MANGLTDREKYAYIKKIYGKDADRILKTFGAYAYDIDKLIPVEAERMGGDKGKKYFKDLWGKQLRSGKFSTVQGVSLLTQYKIPLGATSNAQYNTLRASADAYKKYAAEQAKASEEAKKIADIRKKYGNKADVILKTYGSMAYDIDKNFEKYYNKTVPFGRNYWLNQKGLQEQAAKGRRNKELFEQGRLPLDEAARIINCPAYFGSMNSTINGISKEIKQSAAAYNAKNNSKPKKTRPAAKAGEQKKAGKEKAKEAAKSETRRVLRNQRQVADKVAKLKPNELDEVVVTAKAPEKKKGITQLGTQSTETYDISSNVNSESTQSTETYDISSNVNSGITRLDLKLAELDDSKIKKLDIKSKSPAERKYDELIAKKTADMPDDMQGRNGKEVGLTIGELMKLGVDPKVDFQTIIKKIKEKEDRPAAEKLIPAEGFGDKKVVISKELAIAAIESAQIREMSKKKGINNARA